MNKSCFVAISLVLALATGKVWPEEGDAILGRWLTEGGRSHVEVSKSGDQYSGTIIWMKDTVYESGDPEEGKAIHDRENPDPALRDKPLVGLKMLKGFQFNGKDTWKGGTVYDPENGKTYSCKVTLSEDGKTLNVRGYIGISLIGRTTVWTRVENPAAPESK